ALAWLRTLAWGWHRQRRRPSAGAGPALPGSQDSVHARASLQRALDTGDLGDVADALCATARPPAQGLDEVAERLADPRQREAVALLQRARWAGGDGSVARRALREAFRRGPRWAPRQAAQQDDPLPPLYP